MRLPGGCYCTCITGAIATHSNLFLLENHQHILHKYWQAGLCQCHSISPRLVRVDIPSTNASARSNMSLSSWIIRCIPLSHRKVPHRYPNTSPVTSSLSLSLRIQQHQHQLPSPLSGANPLVVTSPVHLPHAQIPILDSAAYSALEQFVRLKLLLLLDHRYFFGTSASRKMGDDDDDVEAGAGAGAVYRALTPLPQFLLPLSHISGSETCHCLSSPSIPHITDTDVSVGV